MAIFMIPSDFSLVCRTCLSQSQPLSDMNEEKLKELFTQLTKLKISSEDRLPQGICLLCIDIFQNILNFKEKCRTADSILRQALEKKDLDEISPKNTLFADKTINSTHENVLEVVEIVDSDEETQQEDEITEIKQNEIPSNKENSIEKCCKCCGEKFYGAKKLREHFIQNKTCMKNQFYCHVCSKSFSGRYRWKAHMGSHSKESPSRNNIHAKTLKFTRNLLRPQNIHKKKEKTDDISNNEIQLNSRCSVEEYEECNYCGEKFMKIKELMRHYDQKEICLKNRYQCPLCSKAFPRRFKVKIHMRSHIEGKPVNCEICSKAFRHESHLRRHAKVHEEIKRYMCHVCGKAFRRADAHRDHLRIHADEISFTCEYCGKGFRTYACYRGHIMRHQKPDTMKSRVPEFLCHVCGKQYKSKSVLQVHLRVHTGEKPYKCSYCDKSFAQWSTIAQHNMVHTGRRPHVCSFCNKGFTISSNLKIHMKIHTRKASYLCSICGLGFHNPIKLTKHEMKHGKVINSFEDQDVEWRGNEVFQPLHHN